MRPDLEGAGLACGADAGGETRILLGLVGLTSTGGAWMTAFAASASACGRQGSQYKGCDL